MHSYSDLLQAVLAFDLNLNQIKYNIILQNYEDLEEALSDRFGKLFKYNQTSNISKRWLNKIQEFDWQSVNSKIENLEKNLSLNQINILRFKNFNESLKISGDFPIVLYFQGNLKVLESKHNLSIVGSRQILNYTSKVLEMILNGLAEININIVSGLAQGVDSLAHSLALGFNIECLGFIGSGLDSENFYPSQNCYLKDKIVDSGGLVCSQYPPGYRATTFSFPLRNRFIAAVSNLVWIVQAGEKSGSLITAKLALDYGKTVATTPSSVLDPLFGGNIKLLKDGAQIITQAQDILDLMNLNSSKSTLRSQKHTDKIDISQKSKNIQLIYKHLNHEAKSTQELMIATQIPISILNTELSLMELDGLIEKVDQNGWIMC